MLCTANIEIYVAPVFISLFTYEGFLVLRIHIAQIVGRRTCESGHGVEFEREYALMVYQTLIYYLVGLGIPRPQLGTAQWGLARLCWLVFVYFRQFQRQTFLRNHIGHIVLVIYGEWLAPIALTTEDGIAQAVIHLDAAQSVGFHIFLGGGNGLLHGQSVEAELC